MSEKFSGKQMLVVALAAGLLFTALPYSFKIGSRWHSMIHPRKNVTVEIDAGKVATGDLRIGWDGAYLLTMPDGQQLRFMKYRTMAIAPAEQAPRFPVIAFIPPLGVILSYGLFVWYMWRKKQPGKLEQQ